MKRLLRRAGLLLLLMPLSGFAHAADQDIRACEFEVKARCASGEARVTLAHATVTRVEIDVYWCALHGRPPFVCTIDSSRTDQASVWSEEAGATLVANKSPWNPQQPDRVKLTIGPDVLIDLSEAQSLGRCGAGAELPRAIVIPAHKSVCRVRFSAP